MKFTVDPIGDRKKWDPEEQQGPASFVDLWLAENPATKEEQEASGLSASKVASQVTRESFAGGFEKELGEIQAGIRKYGSLEAFEAATRNVNYFADSHLVPQWQPSMTMRTASGPCFESHDGEAGIHRTKITPTASVSFEVTDKSLAERTKRVGTDAAILKVAPPSKRVDLSNDFDF